MTSIINCIFSGIFDHKLDNLIHCWALGIPKVNAIGQIKSDFIFFCNILLRAHFANSSWQNSMRVKEIFLLCQEAYFQSNWKQGNMYVYIKMQASFFHSKMYIIAIFFSTTNEVNAVFRSHIFLNFWVLYHFYYGNL